MSVLEEDTQVFIVRIWREPREIAGAEPEWRGVVEHVASKQRRFISELGEISMFIAPYVGGGVWTARSYRQIRRWLHRWREQ
jgi:hypothetical protein